MGFAHCINYAGLVKTLEKSFKRKLGPLPDTLQAATFVCMSSSYLRVNMGCALVILFQVRSLNVPIKDRSPLTGPFLGVPSLQIGQIHLSIEAHCGHHNPTGPYLLESFLDGCL